MSMAEPLKLLILFVQIRILSPYYIMCLCDMEKMFYKDGDICVYQIDLENF